MSWVIRAESQRWRVLREQYRSEGRVHFKNIGAKTKRKEVREQIMDVRFSGGKTRGFRHYRGGQEDRVKIRYQRGIDSDGAAFSGRYEGEMKLGQHVRQESGVGHCHFLEFSEVGGKLARDAQRCR